MTQGMAIRAQYRGLPGRLRDDGYDLPDNLTYDEWWAIGELLQQMERSVQWWLGDWWRYGERRYGEMSSQATKDAIKDKTGYTYGTVMNAATVAKTFENSRRRENLSWGHHQAVASLEPEDADAILTEAESEGLSVFDVRDRARERKQAIRLGQPEASEPPTCAADRPLTLDDLLPDWRRRAEDSGQPLGYLRALIDTQSAGCFARWTD